MKPLPCKECGGQCCNPPAMNQEDAAKIARYTKRAVEQLAPNFWMLSGSWDDKDDIIQVCPAFDTVEKNCSIYKFRPTVCKRYAMVKELPCIYLYPKKAEYFMSQQGKRVINNIIKNKGK